MSTAPTYSGIIPWCYQISDEDIGECIKTYRASPAGKADKRSDADLRPFAVNTLIYKRGERLKG